MLNGVLLLNKDSGFTSHDCVAKVRKLLGQSQVGHLGTLDPRAKGLLPLCLGPSTKLSSFLSCDRKRYAFTIRLGIATNTQDMDGEIVEDAPVPALNQEQINEVTQYFLSNPYDQETPDFSARKIGGKKLYELARDGREVPKLPPRRVELYDVKLRLLNGDTLEGEVECSTGTYIRQLAVDIAKKLGTVGVLFDLVRTEVGPWNVSEGTTLEGLEADLVLNPELRNTSYFIGSDQLMEDRPRYEINPGLWRQIRNGVQPIHISLYDLKRSAKSASRIIGGVESVHQGDLICGIVRDSAEARLGALFQVSFIKNDRLSCRLEKVL